MRIRLRYVGILLIVLTIIAFIINIWLFALLIIIYILCVLGLITFVLLNKMLKLTNWWKNNFVFTKQFVSNEGYREDLHRNYDIVNVGSNPARFAFHYDDVRGENWSTGTQGLDMDLEILRYFHSYIKDGGYVLLPIVAFSSVSGYLEKDRPSHQYLAKFVTILDKIQCKYHPKLRNIGRYMQFPLYYNRKALWYLINDQEPDKRLEMTDQSMSMMDIEKDAAHWMKIWKEEFNIKDLNSTLPDHLIEGRNKSIIMMRNIIGFLKDRGYKPVIISPPMSDALNSYFTEEIKNTYIYSFVEALKDLNVSYLDYTSDEEFVKNEYYFNALFMNLKGRKLFTHRVLMDLGVIGE